MKRTILCLLPVLLVCAFIFLAKGEMQKVEAGPPAPATFINSTPHPAKYPLPVYNRFPVTKRVHEIVTKKGGPATEAEMKNYTEVVPRADNAEIKMIALKGGEFTMGSPESEEGREETEIQRKFKVHPFWIAECEITWAAYQSFYQNGVARHKDGTLLAEGEEFQSTVKGGEKEKAKADKLSRGDRADIVDVVTQPTPQYHDMFGSGDFKNDQSYPAMDMTHHAASKFCKWLSAQTGHFYRLPTETEWEYACRAGTTTAFSFGDDISKLDDYAWHGDISDYTYYPVRQKKPNPWGLYDMHGNVAEWVLDGDSETFRASIMDGALNPWNIPIKRYPRIAKGGSWDHDDVDCRSAARMVSENDWKDTDPQVPKSIWYHTDAQFVGFRIIRPLKTPTAEEMHLYWNTDWWEPRRNGEDL